MKLTDYLWGGLINLLAAHTSAMALIDLTGFKPGQWQHDVTYIIWMLLMTPISFATCMDVFGRYTKLTVEIIRDESMEETSSDS